jgi:hypothetical protein
MSTLNAYQCRQGAIKEMAQFADVHSPSGNNEFTKFHKEKP